jgi:hypothetical protein
MTEKDNTIIKPNKYHNGKIYTIRCRDDDTLIYVGSSCLPLHKRFYQHKQFMKKDKYKNILLYKKMNSLGIDKFYIELYENFKCDTKEELKKHEGEVIRKIATMNMRIEGRTKQEYQQNPEVKEYHKHYDKEYYENNKNRIKEVKKKYRDNNLDKTKEVKKKYYEINKNKILDKMKEYYKINKTKMKECYETNKNEINDKIVCDCGCFINRSHISRHKKTQKHLNLLEQLKTSTKEVVV